MASKRHRMPIDGDHLISEVEARPALWDKAAKGYSDRKLKARLWREVANAMFDDFDDLEPEEQAELDKSLRTRWKSIRDYFTKGMMEAERSGASPSKRKPISYEDSLRFLISKKAFRSTSGNFGKKQSQQQQHQQPPQRRSSSSATASRAQTEEEEEEEESGTSCMFMDIPDSPSTRSNTPSPTPNIRSPATTSGADAATVTTAASQAETTSARPRRVPLQIRRNVRTPQIPDKELDVENETLSLIRRVDAKDDFDNFGSLMAASCRRMDRNLVGHFMTLSLTMSTAFELAKSMPPVVDMVKGLHIALGLRESTNDQAIQTDIQSQVQLPTSRVPSNNPFYPQYQYYSQYNVGPSQRTSARHDPSTMGRSPTSFTDLS
ncbi:uncharacterized protein [Dendropsophus ebraccatus]|uniref:uncharacterized protein n=1 Tax=Dendropsophus ebraccatus TaxID=150705 RepID=UPI003831E70D